MRNQYIAKIERTVCNLQLDELNMKSDFIFNWMNPNRGAGWCKGGNRNGEWWGIPLIEHNK